MTRVIAGAWGGRRLATPPGDGTRPTSDRVRESLFSSLESLLGGFDGVRVADLYAGSGALGIEALSRGAASATFVEKDARAAAVVRANLAAVGARGQVHRGSVETWQQGADTFTLAFLDPPYALEPERLADVLGQLVPRLEPDAVVVVERSSRTADVAWPEGIEALRDKKYGETRLWYGRRVSETHP